MRGSQMYILYRGKMGISRKKYRKSSQKNEGWGLGGMYRFMVPTLSTGQHGTIPAWEDTDLNIQT